MNKDIVKEGGFQYIVPPSLKGKVIYHDAGYMPDGGVARRSQSAEEYYAETMDYLQHAYATLLSATDPWSKENVKAEDARFVLPNGCETQLMWTVNGRALIETSRKRLCSHAQWEIRDLFVQVRDLVAKTCPIVARNMGPSCEFGLCKRHCDTPNPAPNSYKKAGV
jgi:thymidylate synthase (FAD)